MKRTIACVLLALLLCGCSKQPAAETTAPPVQEEKLSFADSLLVTEGYQEPEDPRERLQWRRQRVVEQMNTMAGVLWSPTQEITYDYGSGPVTLPADRVYRGMPYSHGSSGLMSFLSLAADKTDRGVYILEGLNTECLNGMPNTAYISNDCADMLFWAWGTVSGSVTFTGTKQMTEMAGCIPVGDYEMNFEVHTGATDAILESYGREHMFACYAQVQPGDGFVRYTKNSQGHAIMATQVQVVCNADGTVNGEESFVLITDQGGMNIAEATPQFDEQLGQEVTALCRIDHKMSFHSLYKKGYLPVTCKELTDPAPLQEERVELTVDIENADSLLSGELVSNYRISHLRMKLYDESGSCVQQAVGYVQERDMYRYKLSNLRQRSAALMTAVEGGIDPKALSAGSYRCVLTCTLSTGRTVTVCDIEFQK